MRQLARRGTRGASIDSDTPVDRMASPLDMQRERSFSGSSAMLLQRRAGSDGRISAGLDSALGTYSRAGSSAYGSTAAGGHSRTFSSANGQAFGSESSPRSSVVMTPQPDLYYRPPRQRRRTADSVGYLANGGRDIQSPRSADFAHEEDSGDGGGVTETPPTNSGGESTPPAAYVQTARDELDSEDPQHTTKDYAVREVDFYYGAHGQPPSHTSTRKMKTGPADPTGPVSSASGFIRGLFQGKTKDKGKGFEVVRSSRVPPLQQMTSDEDAHDQEPYRDYPDEGDASASGSGGRAQSRQASINLLGAYDENSDGEGNNNGTTNNTGESRPQGTKLMRSMRTGGDIELSNRSGSPSSSNNRHRPPPLLLNPPSIPRRSSRRHSRESMDHSPDRRSEDYQGGGGYGYIGEGDLAAEDSGRGSVSGSERLDLASSSASTSIRRSQIPEGAGRLPFSTDSNSHERKHSLASTTGSTSSAGGGGGGTSGGGGHCSGGRHGQIPGSHGHHFEEEQPSGMGYVAQHRASDNIIHQVITNEHSFAGRSAEVVEEVPTPPPTMPYHPSGH